MTPPSPKSFLRSFSLVSISILVLGCSPTGSPAIGSAPDTGDGDGDAATAPTAICEVGERSCGDECCAEGQVCATNGTCCTADVLCGSSCCSAGEICEGALCHLECARESVRCHDDSAAEICCGTGEVCAADRCFLPDTPCEDFWDCSDGSYCDSALGFCLPQPSEGEPCQLSSSGGEVVPTELWHWDGTDAVLPAWNQVMMTPVVANLNDDDGNGIIDQNDIPDVVFSSFCGDATNVACTGGEYHENGVLRAVSGADGSALFDVTEESLRVIPGAQIALGDIDGDDLVEIVACGSDPSWEGPLVAFENDGTFKWRSSDPRVRCGQSAPSIADLDADGRPEVFVRYSVLNGADGSVVWHRDCRNPGDFELASGSGDFTVLERVTYEHLSCDYTTAADLDRSGRLSIVGGNVAYDYSGRLRWDRSADFRDGYPAVGDLDLDGTPEIVVVHSAFDPRYARGDHQVRVLDHTGHDELGPVDINVPDMNRTDAYRAELAESRVAGGGPPTIANFDGDDPPEIALAGAFGYVVFEPDLTPKWFAPTHDHSSRKTGSSVFDFDGDGTAEAVYNDEYWLRVYDGADGRVRYCECNTSITHWEYPVIVDANNDGHAEIIVSSNDFYIRSCPASEAPDACTQARVAAGETRGTHGVRVLAAPARDWVATRRIWNQHTYHVTNVTESGGIPSSERANWMMSGLNNFRQNVQPGARNIPDLVPIELSVDLSECADAMTLHFRLSNAGWAAVSAGVDVAVYADGGGDGWIPVGTVRTTRHLLPGESEPLSIRYPLDSRDGYAPVVFLVVAGESADGAPSAVVECRDDNNEATIEASCTLVI
jgi:hypothetical protein